MIRASSPISRAPVLVVVLFFAISIGLVLVGAQRSLDPAPSVTIAAPGTPERPRAVTVIMRDYRFDPTPLVLIPGETIRLTVFNGGLVEHELALGEADFQQAWAAADLATPPAPFTTPPPASIRPGIPGLRVLLGSGGREVVELRVPEDADLLLRCNIPGHPEQGMVGAVELRAAG